MGADTHPSTHPPLPPTTEDAQLSWLRLLRSRRIGIATFYRLLHEHGTAEAALDALPAIARAAGVDGYSPCPPAVVQRELARARSCGARLVCVGTPFYPASLLDLPDPPPMLWIKGEIAALTRPIIAMVGTRTPSSLGQRMARALAEDLSAEGFVIVSGLARGIDTAAHEASLSGGTIAVMAGGIDCIYPDSNTRLAAALQPHGLLLSEQPMGMSPAAGHFPRRNRLISGLAQGVVVVEASVRSGSLITARNALDQGREVMAVPAHPMDPRGAGCNLLLRDGATLVRNAADVIEALGPASGTPPRPVSTAHGGAAAQESGPDSGPQTIPAPPRPDAATTPAALRPLQQMQRLHQVILDRLGPAPLAEDALIRDLGTAPGSVAPALTELELDGRIERQPGGLIARVS